MNDLFNRDDGSLQQGLANLATKYFDATSDYNKTHKDKPKMHIDFQQFHGMDWDKTVEKILSGDVIGQVLQSGSDAVKTALRTGASILTSGAELASGGLALGVLTDLVVDQATEMFTKHKNVFETYQKGQWVFVDRGPSRDKKKKISNYIWNQACLKIMTMSWRNPNRVDNTVPVFIWKVCQRPDSI